MRNTRNWKHTTKYRKQYGNRNCTLVEYDESYKTVRIHNKHLTPFMVATIKDN